MKCLDQVFNDYQIGSIRKEITEMEEKLKNHSTWGETPEEIRKFKKMENRHAELLQLEEVIWRQRSRAVWLKDGDRNTKFFFAKAAQRKKVNEIKKLKDQNVIWRHGEENVERVLIDYYSDLFSTSDPSNIEETVQVVRGMLQEDHKEWCNGDFTREEILEAINQMYPVKAPRS
jgi:hypothetical protein